MVPRRPHIHRVVTRLRSVPVFLAGPGRTWLLLAAAAMLPLLLFGGWAGYLSAIDMLAETRRAAIVTAETAAERIAVELAGQAAVLQALAAASSLDTMDIAAFRRFAERVQSQHALWQTVELASPSGAQVMNLLQPDGTALGPTADAESFKRVLRERRLIVSGVGPVGPVSKRRLVTLQMPVIRDDRLLAVLSIGMAPDAIGSLLRQAGAPAAWIGVVIDASGRIVARTHDDARDQGAFASDKLRAAIKHAPDGELSGRSLEGVDVQTVYRTLAGSDGWVIAFGIPRHLLEAPVRRSLALLMAEGGAGLLLASLLSWLVAKDLAQRRTDDADRAERSLRASEEGRALAVEAAELGVWRWRQDADTFDASPRCLDLLCVAVRTASGPMRWVDAFGAAAEADRAALRVSVERSLLEDEPLDEEIQLQASNGPPCWIRINGRRLSDAGESHQLQGVVADITATKQAESVRLELLRGMAASQEQERRRIARELHDQVGQTVTGLSLGLKLLQDGLPALGADPAVRDRVAWLRSLAAEIGQDIHRAASDLRPLALDDFGLIAAVSALARRWGEQHDITVDVQTLGATDRMDPDIETVIYRVVQESLTNVVKHARAETVSVLLERRDDGVRLIVEDDGIGFDPAATSVDGRIPQGLSGMRERLRLVGGSLELETAPGSGTTLFIRVPDPAAGPS